MASQRPLVLSGGIVQQLATGDTLALSTLAEAVRTTTSTKAANYTAAAGEIVVCDSSGGAFTVTLPSAPANGTLVTVAKIDTSQNAVTVSRGGTDVLFGGSITSTKIYGAYQAQNWIYSSASTAWRSLDKLEPLKMTILVQSGIRALGYGDVPEGVWMDQASIFYVRWRCGTADGSGTTTVNLMSNTANASTGSAISGAVLSGATITNNYVSSWFGPFSLAESTYLQTYVSSLGGTPGSRLYTDLVGVYI